MAYISTDEVKAVRVALKERFKNKLKFSVRREHYSSLNVSIVSGEINFFDGSLDRKDSWNKEAPSHKFDGYEQINEYYPENYGKHSELFKNIVEIMKTAPANVKGGRAWYDNSDAMTDYFDTAYYTHINVGKWDKPYEFKGAK
tara:strand:- start:8 stop:436 length:429 start_codon:yes stop_codon:yes gene_type:complete